MGIAGIFFSCVKKASDKGKVNLALLKSFTVVISKVVITFDCAQITQQ